MQKRAFNPSSLFGQKTTWFKVHLEPAMKVTEINQSYLIRALKVWYHNPGVALLRAIEAYLIDNSEIKKPILDIGSGDGYFSSVMDRYIEFGLDPDIPELKYAKKVGRYKYLVCADICSTAPFKSTSFNTVISNSVFEHIIKLGEALCEVRRLLIKDGLFIITVPTDKYGANTFIASLLRKIGMLNNAMKYEQYLDKRFVHYNRMSVEKWKTQIKRSGFVVLGTTTCWSPFAMQVWDLSNLITNFGLGRLRIGAILKRIPSPFCNLLIHFWRIILLPIYCEDILRCPKNGGNCLIIASPNNSYAAFIKKR